MANESPTENKGLRAPHLRAKLLVMQTAQNTSALPLETIIRAVNCLYDPNTNQETRKQADLYLNQLKESLQVNAFEQLADAFLQVFRSNADGKCATEYFLLTLFETCFQRMLSDIVLSKSELNVGQLVERQIKPSLWRFVVHSTGQQGLQVPSFLKKRLVSLFSFIALRTWPQYWPNLFDDLVSFCPYVVDN